MKELEKTLNKMIDEITSNELNCLLFVEPNDWIKTIQRYGNTYEDKIGIYCYSGSISVKLYCLLYNHNQSHETHKLIRCRFECIREIYYRWCFLQQITPNHKEGWFKSKKFKQYLDSINFYKTNYVIIQY